MVQLALAGIAGSDPPAPKTWQESRDVTRWPSERWQGPGTMPKRGDAVVWGEFHKRDPWRHG